MSQKREWKRGVYDKSASLVSEMICLNPFFILNSDGLRLDVFLIQSGFIFIAMTNVVSESCAL